MILLVLEMGGVLICGGKQQQQVNTEKERACETSARQPLGTQHTLQEHPYSNEGSNTHPNTPQIPMTSLLTRIIFSGVFIQASSCVVLGAHLF